MSGQETTMSDPFETLAYLADHGLPYVVARARAYEAGEDWSVCGPHRSAVQWADATNCRVGYYENDTLACRMVSRRLCPTIKEEK